MSRWNLSWLLGVGLVSLIGFALVLHLPAQGPQQNKHENLKLLVDVLEEVQGKYVKDLDKAKMRELVENMINGGLEQLDPHSSFINADEYKQFQRQSRGKFGGVGIRIGHDRSGVLFVESPMVNTPAYDAGILAGDLILKIDGHSVRNLGGTGAERLKKAVELIQGEPGKAVVLNVLHEGAKKPVDISIVRAEIHVDSVLGDTRMERDLKKWDFMVDKVNLIAYIRISAFTETTVEELTQVVEQLQKDGVRGLVLDLRNNPGGLLRSAVEVSSMFLPEGKRIVSTKGRNQKEEAYDARRPRNGPAPQTSYPIAILLNRYSASASEIVAAALQDHARAVVVGERSYGKGSVQNIIPMEGGASALKLTTASYWRPSGTNIHRFPDSKEDDDWGVKPNRDVQAKFLGFAFHWTKERGWAGGPGQDFEVRLPEEERLEYYRWRRERDIIRRPGQPAPKLKEGEKARPEFKDRVMEKALDHLRSEIRRAGAAPANPNDAGAELRRPRVGPGAPVPSAGRAALEPRTRPD
jgi:carboxyl-terminal processing protease